MSERVSYVGDTPIPGVEWPEPVQPELPIEMLLSEWTDAELLHLLDDLHTEVDAHEKTGAPGLGVKLEAYNEIWDVAIDRGLVSACRD